MVVPDDAVATTFMGLPLVLALSLTLEYVGIL
jgi:hypothetical protein